MRVGGELRPVDLARAVGMSAQSVRRYEEHGFLPPAERGPSGYRLYTHLHLHAIEASREMISGYGWLNALRIMQAVHQGDLDAACAMVDARHDGLDRARREVDETARALREVAAHWEPGARVRRRRGLRIGEVARRTGVRVSALRFWEQRGLLRPTRDEESGYRLYDDREVRNAQVVVLLRRAGYGFEAIRSVLDELAGGSPELALEALERRRRDLAQASRRCSAATSAFWEYARARERYTRRS